MVNKELDRYEWMRETAQHLRSGKLSEIDPVAVADWFDEVSGSDRREVASRLRRIIEHRLKLDYVTGPDLERNRRGWNITINEQTAQMQSIFDESPSLRGQLTQEFLEKTYASVRRGVAEAYDVQPPEVCPYTYAELIE